MGPSLHSRFQSHKKEEAISVNAKSRLLAGKILAMVFFSTVEAFYSIMFLHKRRKCCKAKTALTVSKLNKMHQIALIHPPYSPNISPCDFYLLMPFKQGTEGQQLMTWEQQGLVRNCVLTERFYDIGIRNVFSSWEKLISVAGSYEEK